MPAPLAAGCAQTVEDSFTGPSLAAGFDAPTYMADNRWCDDWDYTCTVGYTVEDTQSAAKEAATTAGRRASASGQRAPTRY